MPLYDDPTLPPGWRRTVTQRKSGVTAGGWDTYITAPPSHRNKKFRSKQDVRRYFEKMGEQYLDWRDFDFNPYGSKGQQEMLQNASVMEISDLDQDNEIISDCSMDASDIEGQAVISDVEGKENYEIEFDEVTLISSPEPQLEQELDEEVEVSKSVNTTDEGMPEQQQRQPSVEAPSLLEDG